MDTIHFSSHHLIDALIMRVTVLIPLFFPIPSFSYAVYDVSFASFSLLSGCVRDCPFRF